MNATELIQRLTHQGYSMYPKAGNILRVEPVPPPEILAMLREHKPEILAALRRRQTPATANAAARLAGTPTGGAEATPAATAQAVERLVLYIGRRDRLRAWSRWPLDEKYWQPELN